MMTADSRQAELRSILTATRVGALILDPPPILQAADTLSDAVRMMRAESHGCAVVCQDGRLSGIVTERDLLRVLGRGESLDRPLADVMTAAPQTVTVEDTLRDAMTWMDRGGYRRLPVVDAAGAPVGVVDVKSIAHFLVEHFPAAVYNQASHAHSVARNREGA